MEEEGDKHQSHPKLKPLYFPVQLRRLPEIIKDLEFHYGSDWKDQIRPLEAMEHYVARLVQLREEDPMLLAAHQYLRYMGDLAGGQILKKIYSKTYNLSNSDGIHFHEFQNISDQDEFKKLYRSRLDSLHLGREDADRMVDETLKGYDFHIQLFAQLAELCDINPKPQVEVEDSPPAHAAAASETSEIPLLVGRSQESNSTGTQFVVFGVVLALFAILYAHFLA